jgi:hypothetical protein
MALAPLTITAERERVIEFTKPFLSQGISIMVYKPRKSFPGMFSFMNPLSDFAWLAVLGAYFCVSAVMFVIYKLTTAHTKETAQSFSEDYHGKLFSGKPSSIQKNGNHATSCVFHSHRATPAIVELDKPTISDILWTAFSIFAYQHKGQCVNQRYYSH